MARRRRNESSLEERGRPAHGLAVLELLNRSVGFPGSVRVEEGGGRGCCCTRCQAGPASTLIERSWRFGGRKKKREEGQDVYWRAVREARGRVPPCVGTKLGL